MFGITWSAIRFKHLNHLIGFFLGHFDLGGKEGVVPLVKEKNAREAGFWDGFEQNTFGESDGLVVYVKQIIFNLIFCVLVGVPAYE